MICSKALKITNKDIIYAQINRGYSDNWELNLYLKFGDEERHIGTFQPVDLNLNLKWYEINEVKGLIDDYLEDEEAKYTANFENEQEWLTTIIDLEYENIKWQGCE